MPSLPLVGEELAGYRLRGVLGRGGMSVVFQAENVRLGNVVALKVLAPELSSDDRFRTRFLHESRMTAALNHPNVIPVYDSGSFEDLLYISMRYVTGADLRRLLRSGGELPPATTLSLLDQTSRALDAAHRAGLIHRDVKPANILIEKADENEPEHVYLADFGIAKHALSISGLTSTGQFVGTLDYIAPEQIRGGHVDERTDLYSLGCVVYECLTGQVPFRKDVDAAVLWAHVEEEPERPSAVRTNLPRAIDDVILRAMAKRPEDRYASCRQFLTAARAALDPATGLAASADTGLPRALKPPQIPSESSEAVEPARSSEAVDRMGDVPSRTGPSSRGETESAASPGGPGGRPPTNWPPPDAISGRSPRRSRPALQFGVLGAAAAVIVAIVLVLALSGGGSRKNHSAMAASGGSHMKMDASLRHSTLMKALAGVNTNRYSRNLLPLSTCTPQSASKVTCANVTNSASQVIFETYPSLTALYRAYTAQYRAINRTPFRANYRDCNEIHDQGEVSWNHAGTHSRSYSLAQLTMATVSPDEAFGRLFCGYSSSYQFHIVWTQNQGRLLGTVMGGPHDATWDWWHHVHHTISFSGSPMSMSGKMQ